MVLHSINQTNFVLQKGSCFCLLSGPKFHQWAGICVGSVLGMVSDGVKDPVHLCGPSTMVSVIHLLHEIV